MAISPRYWESSAAGPSAGDWRIGGALADVMVMGATAFSAPRSQRYIFRSSQGWQVAVEADGELPPWFRSVVRSLQDLVRLPAGWDLGVARAIDRRALVAAIEVLHEFLPDGSPVPSLVPTVRGGLAIEWHIEELDLELEIQPGGEHIELFYEDGRQQFSWEGRLDKVSSPILQDAISALVRRLGGR